MNLSAAIFDKVRIPVRQTPQAIGDRLCREAGLDPESVRHGVLTGGRGTQGGIVTLRCRIAHAMRREGWTAELMLTWFTGLTPSTLRIYAAQGAHLEDGQ